MSAAAWHHDAACRDEDPELFFPPDKDTGTIATATTVCARCPVRAACLDTALAGGESGIWGGTTEDKRRKLRQRTVVAA